jgi:hypothetical protein
MIAGFGSVTPAGCGIATVSCAICHAILPA